MNLISYFIHKLFRKNLEHFFYNHILREILHKFETCFG
jgi:hypothetical protein